MKTKPLWEYRGRKRPKLATDRGVGGNPPGTIRACHVPLPNCGNQFRGCCRRIASQAATGSCTNRLPPS